MHDETTNGSTWTQDGSFTEYRYDPLGRRIMERTRRDAVCAPFRHDCESTLTRFVWTGDQLLWELRVLGGNNVPATSTGLESTYATGDFYGRVSYFHAGGIDKPLLITKEGAESVVPRETWRGQFHKGTSPVTGAVRDCPIGVQTGCLLIAWPGMETNAAHSWGGEKPDIRVWYGGLVDGMRDASGQMYMRNRYYDPATGQFTQTDPIGLAGGLNAYGFAAGDPVSYSDPYGLCPKIIRMAPLALADGPAPIMEIGLGVACVAELGAIGYKWYRTARVAHSLLSAANIASEEPPAAAQLPDLTGKTEDEAEEALTEGGFHRGQNSGSYKRYNHEDGSQISVSPEGRVVRQGPQVQSGENSRAYRRRYGPDGKQIQHDPSGANTHNTGEVIRVR